MDKIKVVAIFGKCASGKDTIQNWLVKNSNNFHKIISYTTREKREQEVDGYDYWFINTNTFTSKVLDGTMLEAVEFGGNFYGAGFDQLMPNKINIGVFELNGIRALLEDDRIEVFPIYIAANDKVRILRMMHREEQPNCLKLCQRFIEEDKMFAKDSIDFDFMWYENSDSTTGFSDLLKTLNNLGQE